MGGTRLPIQLLLRIACWAGAREPVGRSLVLGRAEPTLSLPELQEQVCPQAQERRERKKQNQNTKPNQKTPFLSDPKGTVKSFRQSRKPGKGTGLRSREKEQTAGRVHLF